MVIPIVRVSLYRHPRHYKEFLVVMFVMSDDLNVIKIHLMMTIVEMARKFGVMIEHQDSIFVLGNPRLQ